MKTVKLHNFRIDWLPYFSRWGFWYNSCGARCWCLGLGKLHIYWVSPECPVFNEEEYE